MNYVVLHLVGNISRIILRVHGPLDVKLMILHFKYNMQSTYNNVFSVLDCCLSVE